MALRLRGLISSFHVFVNLPLERFQLPGTRCVSPAALFKDCELPVQGVREQVKFLERKAVQSH